MHNFIRDCMCLRRDITQFYKIIRATLLIHTLSVSLAHRLLFDMIDSVSIRNTYTVHVHVNWTRVCTGCYGYVGPQAIPLYSSIYSAVYVRLGLWSSHGAACDRSRARSAGLGLGVRVRVRVWAVSY